MAAVNVIFPARERTGVVFAIDWENIRRSAVHCGVQITATDLCDILFGIGSLFGDVVGAKTFGDWSANLDDGAEFSRNSVQPYHAPRTVHGKDRSDAAMILEVWDWVRDQQGVGIVILATGDADFQILVDKCKSINVRVLLTAFAPNLSSDMRAVAPFFPIEGELESARRPVHGDVPVFVNNDLPPHSQALLRFVPRMDQFSRTLSFVGYGKLCHEWMIDWGVANTERDCFDFMDIWQEQGVVETYSVNNPGNPRYPTTAVRLCKDHPKVREILDQNTLGGPPDSDDGTTLPLHRSTNL